MISSDFHPYLACPETGQPLRPADDRLIARVNDAISAGSLRNRAGAPISLPLQEGLVREDGRVLYPVRNDIPVLLAEEAVDLRPDLPL